MNDWGDMLAKILAASVSAVAAIAVGYLGYLVNSLRRQLKLGAQDRQLTAMRASGL